MLSVKDTNNPQKKTLAAKKNVIRSQIKNNLTLTHIHFSRIINRIPEIIMLILESNNSNIYLSNQRVLDFIKLS